ncbi:hypothetical protein FNV43_RR07243 [Rhamnella rubrinervis]|uniref:Uncharacterized protein n=1 Tax=Rhamnella rubrinervis TaxID=2594499 RepID=A0A8K0HEK5_9ROSA|nr:hypothetical protein FNV43_RR07243 [Rhamnella rubrinervis]
MVELEKQRMQFAKDLEVQRMRMFMDTQVQLERIKRGRRSGSNVLLLKVIMLQFVNGQCLARDKEGLRKLIDSNLPLVALVDDTTVFQVSSYDDHFPFELDMD